MRNGLLFVTKSVLHAMSLFCCSSIHSVVPSFCVFLSHAFSPRPARVGRFVVSFFLFFFFILFLGRFNDRRFRMNLKATCSPSMKFFPKTGMIKVPVTKFHVRWMDRSTSGDFATHDARGNDLVLDAFVVFRDTREFCL